MLYLENCALCTLIAGFSKAQIKANETLSFPYVFFIGSIVMIVGMLVLLFFVKEQDTSIKLKGEANQYADEKARKKAQGRSICRRLTPSSDSSKRMR